MERGGCGVRCLTRCWVLKDRAAPGRPLVSGRVGVAGFLLVVGPAEHAALSVWGVGCRLYVENFTVDASIFVVSSF